MTSGKILFLSTADSYASKVAEILFQRESERVELGWTASSGVVADGVSSLPPPDHNLVVALGFASADELPRTQALSELEFDFAGSRVILLGSSDSEAILKGALPDQKAAGYEVDLWTTLEKNSASLLEALQADIASYAVRLIMQGGRRPALPGSNSSGTASSKEQKKDKKSKVRVSLESKGRRGKQVTCISGLPLDDDEMQSLATRLKQRCGTGGTVKERRIEIQGDNCEKTLAYLNELGYQAKRSGAPSRKK